ncbi:MAG: protein translocase subunit SecD [Pseudomonadota bacterium]
MLQFPSWKVALIVLALVAGIFMALPNGFSNAFLGVEPERPSVETPEALAEYIEARDAARESWWPGFLPTNKVNLGLDLRGGVYLLMEITEDDVVQNRLRVFSADVLQAFSTGGGADRVYATTETRDDTLAITLNERRMDATTMETALDRLDAINTPVQGAIGGARTYTIDQTSSTQIEVSITDAARSAFKKEALSKTIEIVRRRIDPDGVRDIAPQPQGENRIILEVPGEPDPRAIKDVLSQAGELTFSLVDDTPSRVQQAVTTGRNPPGWRLLTYVDRGERMLVNNAPVVTGSDVASAIQGYDPDDNTPAVNFRLNGAGQQRFSKVTLENVNRRFAIVLDERVMSAPVIRQPIYGGQVQISGGFPNNAAGLQEAIDLAAIIEAGELPAKLNFIEERTVGPGLGEDSIRAGTLASMIGLALVAISMALIYGRLGLFAVLSLAANIILILGALSGLGATLTLPGIAGIILTIGMAVDANVLVFERIREESRSGRSAITAVQAGYEKAMSTILDANITTFIAAAVLYMLGSGPVKGFAVTLAIGIFTSVFTAFVVTRWFTVMWLKTARPKKLAV